MLKARESPDSIHTTGPEETTAQRVSEVTRKSTPTLSPQRVPKHRTVPEMSTRPPPHYPQITTTEKFSKLTLQIQEKFGNTSSSF
nr:hypothetical protein BgiMline_032244 [Biomphalaria glabrata]